MPRPKKAIPDRLDGRASLASEVEKVSAEAFELAARLRKPGSLILSELLRNAADQLLGASQNLSDLSVGITLGKVPIAEVERDREIQLPLFEQSVFDALPAPIEV